MNAESTPYKQAASMSSLRLPSLSPKMKAPTEPARAPNKELLTTRPERKGDKLYLHWTQDQRCIL